MLNREFYINGETYKQVSKVKASKAFVAGDTVFLIPCNASPHSPWVSFCPIKNDGDRTFDQHANEFRWYNCNSEMGRYVHFYLKGA